MEGAVEEAHAWIDLRYETTFDPYFDNAYWAVPASAELMKAAQTSYETPTTYPVDARGVTDYWAFSTVKHLGAGQFYLMSTKDKSGTPLDGGKSYKLVVPADVPIEQYWSAVVYDRATHALIRDVASPSKSSLTPGLTINADGSVDLYFGPTAPSGKEFELDADEAGRPLRGSIPVVRPEEGAVRKDMETSRPHQRKLRTTKCSRQPL